MTNFRRSLSIMWQSNVHRERNNEVSVTIEIRFEWVYNCIIVVEIIISVESRPIVIFGQNSIQASIVANEIQINDIVFTPLNQQCFMLRFIYKIQRIVHVVRALRFRSHSNNSIPILDSVFIWRLRELLHCILLINFQFGWVRQWGITSHQWVFQVLQNACCRETNYNKYLINVSLRIYL